jgi:hypothetical protein
MPNPLHTLALSAALVGCTNPVPATGEGPVGVRIGETAAIGGPKVTPLEVLEDSRCPVGVDCYWPGQVRLRVRIELGSGTSEAELGTLQPLQVGDGELKLVGVTPTRTSTRQIAPADYRFRFEFSGGL